jgi:apolipoprotein D and lipocalin family protein
MFKVLTAASLILACTGAAAAPAQSVQTIPALDVTRYMGTWYEIAKYPNYFQRKCVGNTTADYALQPDKTVQVTNRCEIGKGEAIVATAEGRQVGGAASPRLEVRFAPAWLSFLPFVWVDYWVIDLDEQYQLAAVSEPKREYLWILSRTPHVEPQAYAALLARLEKQGYSLQQLVSTPQAAKTP